MIRYLAIFLVLAFGCVKNCSDSKKIDPRVFFIEPVNEEKVSNPINVVFGVEGINIRPALEDINDKNSGHHHLLIDHPTGYIDKGMVIPFDEHHIHFGNAETSVTINLPSGPHKLSLQFADGGHLSYGKELSASISIIVE